MGIAVTNISEIRVALLVEKNSFLGRKFDVEKSKNPLRENGLCFTSNFCTKKWQYKALFINSSTGFFFQILLGLYVKKS